MYRRYIFTSYLNPNKMNTSKKITLATVKSFIRKNSNNLFIKQKSSFCGMTDCVQSVKSDFSKVELKDMSDKNTYGVQGAWFVGSGRNYFESFENENFTGVEVYNCCGSFVLAINK